MNNKEKRQYINSLHLLNESCFIDEIQLRNQFLKKTPKLLYKYRSFDKFSFEMIEAGYVYLSPVKNLDDPFDCVSDFDLSTIYDEDKKRITNKQIDYIINTNNYGLTKEQIKDIKMVLRNCLGDEGFIKDKTIIELQKKGFSESDSLFLTGLFINCQNLLETYDESGEFKEFAKTAYKPGDKIGVCSLSEVRDNKVMWSLYSKKYEGYCIEYEIPLTTDARRNLLPVLYSRKISNNFTTKLYDAVMADVKRHMSSVSIFTRGYLENVGALSELFCLKDTDWKYQQEWRILGGAEEHFTQIKIKAIYLGFKVTKTNENKIKRLAKKIRFKVFKMNSPKGKKKITYTEII